MIKKVLTLLFVLSLISSKAYAQVDYHSKISCVGAKSIYDVSKTRYYKINTESFKFWGGYDEDMIEAVINSAAETWNSMGNVAPLVYLGRTNDLAFDDLPLTKSECDSKGISYSLFSMYPIGEDSNATANATASGRCRLNNDVGTQFRVHIHRFWDEYDDGNNTIIDWSFSPFSNNACNLSTKTKDMEGMLVHEIGHTYNLGHTPRHDVNGDVIPKDDETTPGDRVAAVMTPSNLTYCWLDGTATRSDTRRDLYPYDMNCSRADTFFSNGQDRSAQPYPVKTQWFQQDNQNVTSSISFNGMYKTTYSEINRSYNHTFAINYECLKDFGLSECISSDSVYAHIPPESFWDFSKTNNDFIFYGNDLNIGSVYPNKFTYRIYTRFTESTDDSVLGKSVDYCEGVCFNNSTNRSVSSSRKSTISYNDKLDKRIMAWTSHHPQNQKHKDLNLAVFDYDNNDLEFNYVPLTSVGVQIKSDVSPGLICKENAAFQGRDCLVAFVEPDDPFSVIKVVSFDLAGTQPNYSIPMSSAKRNTGIQTASAINMWHADGFFWMVVRDISAYNPTLVYSSTNGSTWLAEYYDPIGLQNIESISHEESPGIGKFQGNILP